MEALKAKYFHSHPDDPIVFHRAEMVNAKPPFDALKKTAIQQAFDAELLAHLAAWDYRIISVCINKKKHKETYSTWHSTPTTIASLSSWNALSSSSITWTPKAMPWPNHAVERKTFA